MGSCSVRQFVFYFLVLHRNLTVGVERIGVVDAQHSSARQTTDSKVLCCLGEAVDRCDRRLREHIVGLMGLVGVGRFLCWFAGTRCRWYSLSLVLAVGPSVAVVQVLSSEIRFLLLPTME